MPKRTRRITEANIVEIIAKRLSGKTQAEIAKEYGVSEQTIQYYEAKESSQAMKELLLQKIGEVVGNGLGEQALERLNIRKGKEEEDDDPNNFILSMDSGAPAATQ